MSQPATTVNDVFLLSEEVRGNGLPIDNWHTFMERIKKESTGLKWLDSTSDILIKITELMDIKIPTIMLSCWKKSEELKKILDESIKSPDEKFELTLTEHKIISEHKPYIDIIFKNVSIYKVEFDLNLNFLLEGFILKIQKGDIYEIIPGNFQAEGTLSWNDINLLNKPLMSIELPGIIQLSDR